MSPEARLHMLSMPPGVGSKEGGLQASLDHAAHPAAGLQVTCLAAFAAGTVPLTLLL